MKNSSNFKNKNILIGGSTNGIGWASAQLFAENGGNITLIARTESLVVKRLAELDNNGQQLHNYIIADFSNPKELEQQLKDFVTKNSIEYDVIINNTGGPPSGELAKASW